MFFIDKFNVLLACVNDLIFEGVDVVRIGFVIGRTIVMM
jgi:hypothetical protein